MKKILTMLLILTICSLAIYSEGQQENSAADNAKLTEWEQMAQLGEFRPEVDNWDEIEAKAKAESGVIVWSNSSKVFAYCKSFYKKYKIKAIPNDLGTGSLFEKLRREQAANIYSTDVVHVSGIAELYNDFMPNKALYKFVPSEIQPLLVPEATENHLLGVFKFGGKMLAYNTEVHGDKSPVDTWWDITRPEWKGKLIMKDPMLGGSDLYMMVSFINKAEEMAASYKEEFGEDIVLSDTENAGYEFIKRFLKNDIILMKGGSPVAEAVGAKGQDAPPLGITGPSKLKLNDESNLAFDMAWDLKPFSMYVSTTTISIAQQAKNPNSAKLMIKWLFGDKNRGLGFKPFDLEGTWSSRSDAIDTVNRFKMSDLKVWEEDAGPLYDNSVYLRDFWIQHM